MEYESSHFSRLPPEVTNEILSSASLREVIVFYDAYSLTPTCNDLNFLCERFGLPYSTSLDVMFAHSETTMDKRIKYCIEYNDVRSLLRLEKVYDEDISWEPFFYRDLIRPKIYSILFWRAVQRKEELSSSDFDLAARHQDLDVIQYLADNKVDLTYNNILEISNYATKEMLDILFRAEYDIAEELLMIGVSYNNLFLVEYTIEKGATGDRVNDVDNAGLPILMLLLELEETWWIAFEHILIHFTKEDVVDAMNILARRGKDVKEILEDTVSEHHISDDYMLGLLTMYENQ